jgi:hypothetical protein
MPYISHTGDKEDAEHEKLMEIRARLKREMERAVQATKDKEKIALAKDWKDKYTDSQYEELLRLARHKEARYKIANWDLGDFDKSRQTNKK